MGIFDRLRGATVRVHVLVKGRIGEQWYDLDDHMRLPAGTTLSQLIESSSQLRAAIANSPHLAETIMLNGERCPIAEHGDRALADGDELYLLAPLAGG